MIIFSIFTHIRLPVDFARLKAYLRAASITSVSEPLRFFLDFEDPPKLSFWGQPFSSHSKHLFLLVPRYGADWVISETVGTILLFCEAFLPILRLKVHFDLTLTWFDLTILLFCSYTEVPYFPFRSDNGLLIFFVLILPFQSAIFPGL